MNTLLEKNSMSTYRLLGIKMLPFMLLVINCANCFANTVEFFCPTPQQIINNQVMMWLPLYSETSELASDSDVKIFKEHLREFVAARWDTSYLETAHCFYGGDDPIFQKIVYARDAWRPTSDSHWV